jgi:hypothetical protein
MTTSEDLLDQLIANQQQSMRYYLLFAVGLILLGVVVMSATTILSNLIVADAFKALFGLGGAFVSSLSAFQIKEIVSRKNTIQTLNKCKLILHTEGAGADAEALKRVDEMVWKAVEKTILGAG